MTYSETYPSWSNKNWSIFICPNIIQSTVIEDKLNAVKPVVNKRTAPTTTKPVMLYVSVWELSYLLCIFKHKLAYLLVDELEEVEFEEEFASNFKVIDVHPKLKSMLYKLITFF